MPDGDARVYETRKFRIEARQAPVVGGISLDVTDARKLSAVLEASEAKYRALVETTATGYLILDGRGLVLDANAEYVRLTGHRALTEILGRSVVDWTVAHEVRRNEAAIAQCARRVHTQLRRRLCRRRRRRDGRRDQCHRCR